MAEHPDRRKVLRLIAVGGAVSIIALPLKWTKPVAESIVVPAHAAASAPTTTGPV